MAGPILLVAAKHVPAGGAALRVDGSRLVRDGVSHGIDPISEVGLEWALQSREAGTAERVAVVTLGPPDAIATLRQGLAMGADEALLVTDAPLSGADVRTTAHVLAAVTRRIGADVLLLGYESLDGSSGVVPAACAALLDRPLVSRFARGEIDGRVLRGTRDMGFGPETIEADLPVVVSVVEGSVAPRYPKLKDVVRTRNAEATILTAGDLDVPAVAGAETSAGLVAVPQPVKEPRIVGLDEGVVELFDVLTKAGA